MRAWAEIVIERPLEAVWAWASDPGNWDRWEPDLSELEPDDYEIVQKPPRQQVVRSVTGPFAFESTLELFPDVGGTRVRQTVTAGPEDALDRLMFVVAGPLVRRGIRSRISGQLERLKTMVELEAVL